MKSVFNGLYAAQNEHDACGVGLLVNIHGNKSHDLVEHALKVLEHMVHRGAERPDQTGDGAGIQVQIPHTFLVSQGIDLPEPGHYGTGLIFLPQDTQRQQDILHIIRTTATQKGLQLLPIREVPIRQSALGLDAQRTCPRIIQVFLTDDPQHQSSTQPHALDLRLYLLRKQWEQQIPDPDFYVVTLSSRTMVYKGMLSSTQLRLFYPDLTHPLFLSSIGLVHSRFSTNTFPTWALAQPFRFIGHNGEINTIRGNRRWMEARESVLRPELFQLDEVLPILQPGMSDSASLDNVLEFFVMSGMSLPHALAMMIPESYNDKNPISPALKAFYEYHSILMEAWDGPAALLFSDGRYAGGMLDRNGLRPARYVITNHDTLVIASEAGVLNLEANNVTRRGRLRPGKMLMVDTQEGRILFDDEIKQQLSRQHPYGDWLALNRINLQDVSSGRKVSNNVENFQRKLQFFGYTQEDIDRILIPMLQNAMEPTAAMGNDTPLAPFSERPQLLFNYFRQQFAQVTNPPIDPIRENLVMSLGGYIGRIGENLLTPGPQLCKMVCMNNPILTNKELDLLRNLQYKGFRTINIDLTFPCPDSDDCRVEERMVKRVNDICQEAVKAVEDGYNYLILTDKQISDSRLAVPSLLATAAVHNYLIRHRRRVQTAIVVEAGDVREVMHFALLMGYGASAVNPYMVLGLIDQLTSNGQLQLDFLTAEKHFIKAVNKGLLKIISKLGISTMGSYKGAQLFEALGLNDDVLHQYFGETRSAFSGVGLARIAADLLRFRQPLTEADTLPDEGRYRWTKNGEHHAWTAEMIRLLRQAVSTNDPALYRRFANLSDKKASPIFIRDFLNYKPATNVTDQSVESVEDIMHRFVAGAISFGAISPEAHRAIALCFNRIGGRSNTGEGGEDSERFNTPTRSAIKQVASGRFGVTANYLMNADEIQIKVAQGAKPGEGGQLPGFKVDNVIARVRHAIPGLTLISPPPHHDIYSIEDLAQLIFDLKTLNPQATVSVKLVAEAGIGTIAAGVAKAKADNIVISGACGGTGASPLSSTFHAGMPMEVGLSEAHQTLVMNGLREHVTLQCDGQIKTGRDIVIAACLGAEEYAFSTALMVAFGCVLCRRCHTNACPQGIATQDAQLRRKLNTEQAADMLERYLRFLAEDVQQHLINMGKHCLSDIIGHTELLDTNTQQFNFDKLLYRPEQSLPELPQYKYNPILPGNQLNDRLLLEAQSAINQQLPVMMTHEIKNTYRAIGTNLAGAIAKRYGDEGLPDDTIMVEFTGSAGQSFGAFLTRGISFLLRGEANDYVGKGLSGGRIVIVPPIGHLYQPEENTIAGNTLLYGATSGQLYANGRVGERFCVRNSGAVAVVEGVGDHGCEYMTGGRVAVLGPVGRNFAAGMSGGIAYVWNPDGNFDYYCHMDTVELTLIDNQQDDDELHTLIADHLHYTGSPLAERMLADWPTYRAQFLKVTPSEYRTVMSSQAHQGAE